ncbi:MAG: restriction endonuclease [Clostridium sp.]
MFKFLSKKFDEAREEREKEELKKRKIEEKRIEIAERDFIKLMENEEVEWFFSYGNTFISIELILEGLQNLNIEISNKQINDTFLELYSLGLDSNKINEFKKKAFEQKKKIIKDRMGINFFQIDMRILEEFIERGQESFNLIIHDSANSELKFLSNIAEFMKEANEKNNNIEAITYGVIAVFLYLISLVEIILIVKDKNLLNENHEFLKLQKNMYEELPNDIRQEKIYSMYTNLYLDIFENIYDSLTFTLIIQLINRRKINFDAIGELDKLEINYQKDDIFEIICKYIDLGVLNDTNVEIIRELYIHIIHKNIEKIKSKEIFDLLLETNEVSDKAVEYLETKKLMLDKERYLAGDFGKEKIIEYWKQKLSNVRDGLEFELFLKDLFEKINYTVKTTKASGDQGADLILIRNGETIVVQAKFYSSPVGNKAVQEVVASMKFYNASRGIVVTNNIYTKGAIELAKANNIELWDGSALEELIYQI